MKQKSVVTAPELDSPYHKALSALGTGLRQERESRAIALQDLASQLFFPPEQLEALEAGDHRRLPEPVYVIAQARRVGQALGLGDDGRIPGLVEVIGSSRPTALVHPLARPVEGDPKRSASRPRRHPVVRRGPLQALLTAGAIACGAAALLSFGWRNQPQRSSEQAGTPVAAAPVAAAAKTAVPPAAGELQLSSGSSSWLEVKTADGRPLFRGTLSGSKRFPLGPGLAVIAGRPDLVRVQVGQAPPRLLGRIEQVSWQRFGPDGGVDP